MRQSMRLKRNAGCADTADDLLWYGYEHLCMVKRPYPLHPVLSCLTPWWILRGMQLVAKASRVSPEATCQRTQGLAKYYVVDLLHVWCSLFLLLGRNGARVAQPFFRFIAYLYDRVATTDPSLMDGEYYWMRHVESRLLAGDLSSAGIDSIAKKLERLEANYRILQNFLQLGNVHAYRGLISFLHGKDRDRRARAIEHLDLAAEAWSKGRPSVAAAGHRRDILFRRFVGGLRFGDAARRLVAPSGKRA